MARLRAGMRLIQPDRIASAQRIARECKAYLSSDNTISSSA